MYFKQLLANTELELPFLFKLKFFTPRWSSLMLLFSIKSIFSIYNNSWSEDLTLKPLSIFFSVFTDHNAENTSLVFCDTFLTRLTISFAWFNKFVPLAKSLVSTERIRQSGLLLITSSIFSSRSHPEVFVSSSHPKVFM